MSSYRNALLAAALLLPLLHLLHLPAAYARPALRASAPAPAPNCGLSTPPPQAGVDRQMGALLRIYPRNPDIGPGYAGCQTLWAEDGEDWAIVTVVHYEAGRVAWIESPTLEHDPLAECRLQGGRLTHGDPELCAELDDMRFESAPAACLDEAREGSAACARR